MGDAKKKKKKKKAVDETGDNNRADSTLTAAEDEEADKEAGTVSEENQVFSSVLVAIAAIVEIAEILT